MPTHNLDRGLGAGSKKLVSDAVTLDDGGTHDTGLSSIDSVTVTPTTASEFASVTGISDGTITVAIKTHDNSAGTEATVHIQAIGDA